MPFALVNIVAGVVYALSLPFVALVTAYVYFDARTRGELEPAQPSELPAEIELQPVLGTVATRKRLVPWIEALAVSTVVQAVAVAGAGPARTSTAPARSQKIAVTRIPTSSLM